MAVYTDSFQVGLKFLLAGEPCSIIEANFTKPGKGQAFTKVKYRNLKTNRVLDKTFKIGEKVEKADILDLKMQFLYRDGDQFIFMNLDNYEQLIATKEVVAGSVNWLIPEGSCSLTLFNGEILGVKLENHVNLKVIDSEPGLKGDSATGATKLVTVETGVKIKVPLFIKRGETIKIDTRTGNYLSRS